jgi:hypothetical protein
MHADLDVDVEKAGSAILNIEHARGFIESSVHVEVRVHV